jgi:hypothetical protein
VRKKAIVHCERCHREAPHKLGKRGRWHCLVCGTENIQLRVGVCIRSGLPPGFLLEKLSSGKLALYVAASADGKAREGVKVTYYLKGTFPADTLPADIESRAWQVYAGHQ